MNGGEKRRIVVISLHKVSHDSRDWSILVEIGRGGQRGQESHVQT